MIIAVYLEDMAETKSAKFFSSLEEFAFSTFKINVSDKGVVTINEDVASMSYNLEEENGYTKEEVYKEFINSRFFKSYAKARFWTVYLVKEQII